MGLADFQPTIWLAAEKYLLKDVSVQVDAGYIIRNIQQPGKLYDAFHIRTELRFYTGNVREGKKSTMNPYVAGQIFYKQQRFYDSRQVCAQPWETVSSKLFGEMYVCKSGTITDKYKYDRYVYGTHLKYGWQWIYPHGFILDMYAGLGIRKIEEYYSATNGYPDNLEDEISFYPGITGGIKIGWMLN